MVKKIMRINLKFVGGIILILIALQVITAYFFGVIAENQFKSQFDKMVDSGVIKVIKYNYNRGWITSSEDVVLQINTAKFNNLTALLPLKPNIESQIANNKVATIYELKYTNNIINGIFAGWLYGNFMPVFAYGKSNIILPESLQKYVQTFFKDKSPLTLWSVIYIDGSGKYQLDSPDFAYEEALSEVKVKWGGAKLVVKFNKEFTDFNNHLYAPELNFYAPTKGQIVINGLDYKSDTTRSLHDIKVGDTNFSLSSLSVKLDESSSDSKFKLGDLVGGMIGINAAEFLNDVDFFNPRDFTLTNVSYNSSSNEIDNYFNSDVKAGFSKLISNDKVYGPLDFDFSLKHIRADKFAAVVDLLESITAIESPTPEQENQFSDRLKVEMTPILIESPLASINKLTLQVPSGLMSIDGILTTHNFESKDMENQSEFLSKIYANGNIAVPKSILSYLLFLQMKYFLSAGNAELDQESNKALSDLVNLLLDNQLQVWLSKGFMQEESGIVKTKFRLDGGIIYLNDHSTSTQDSLKVESNEE